MPVSDAFALKNSGLNEFLFAEVGNEVNGSPLTILSVLARLGMDPWTEAARLTRMPKAAFIDCLTNCISQMPLCPQALLEARATAARLFTLLPSPVLSPRMRQIIPVRASWIPGWLPLVVFAATVLFGTLFAMLPSATPSKTIPPLRDQMTQSPRTPGN